MECLGEALTVLGLEIPVKDGHSTRGHLRRPLQCALGKAQYLRPNIRWINTIVTTVQRQGQLPKDTPDKGFGRSLTLVLEIPNNPAEISISAVFHVQVQVLARLEVFSVVVLDNVVVSKMREDLEFGVELLALLLGHAMVRDLLAAHDEAIVLAAHLANDSERPMSCAETLLACMSQSTEVAQGIQLV